MECRCRVRSLVIKQITRPDIRPCLLSKGFIGLYSVWRYRLVDLLNSAVHKGTSRNQFMLVLYFDNEMMVSLIAALDRDQI